MNRPVLAFVLAFVFAVVAASIATAQADPIKERKDLMGGFGEQQYDILNKMVRGQTPYDQAKVDKAFEVFAAGVKKLPTLFPDNSKPSGPPTDDYSAAGAIWEDKADFHAKIAALAKAVEENRSKATSLDGLKAARAAVNDACNACHKTYRIRNR